MRRWLVFVALSLSLACSDDDNKNSTDGSDMSVQEDASQRDGGEDMPVTDDMRTTGPIEFSSLQDWTRESEPILRDPIDGENYQVASDAHIFRDQTGNLRMIYTGDEGGSASIRLASSENFTDWQIDGTLLSGVGPSGLDVEKETAFYRLADDGKHQIFYIGYETSETYRSQIYLAEADSLEGPYTQQAEPVIGRGLQAGNDVYLITSPTVFEYDGALHMVYLGWNDYLNAVTEVWILAATSTDDGRTWSNIREVTTPTAMEGQVTVGPDGKYYAVRQAEVGEDEIQAIALSRADDPFGTWEELPEPVLIQLGAPYEIDELNAPQIFFDETTRTAYIVYVGAEQLTGWWLMLASTSY